VRLAGYSYLNAGPPTRPAVNEPMDADCTSAEDAREVGFRVVLEQQ
jgi:hypothetical protein